MLSHLFDFYAAFEETLPDIVATVLFPDGLAIDKQKRAITIDNVFLGAATAPEEACCAVRQAFRRPILFDLQVGASRSQDVLLGYVPALTRRGTLLYGDFPARERVAILHLMLPKGVLPARLKRDKEETLPDYEARLRNWEEDRRRAVADLGSYHVLTLGTLLQRSARYALEQITAYFRRNPPETDAQAGVLLKACLPQMFTTLFNRCLDRSPLLQEPDRTNPLAETAQKRKIALQAIDLHSDSNPQREVHIEQRGRLCPVETPESGMIGLNLHLAQDCVVERIDCGDRRGRKEIGWRLAARSDFDPARMFGVSAGLVPFIEHNDANRAMMGAKNMKQALPLEHPETPWVRTGLEEEVGPQSGLCLLAEKPGKAITIHEAFLEVQYDGEKTTRTYRLDFILPGLYGDIGSFYRPVEGLNHFAAGAVLADASTTVRGTLALGTNLLVAYMPWYGYNFEDAIVVSESAARKLTSVHVVVQEQPDSPARDPHPEAPKFRTETRPLQVGDKLTGRHGNKGVVSRILPDSEMPRLPDDTNVEVLLNPHGVISRMNIGVLLETHWGWVLRQRRLQEAAEISVTVRPFEAAYGWDILRPELKTAGAPEGRVEVRWTTPSGEEISASVVAGCQYLMKLNHCAEKKLSARGLGKRMLITRQPARGRKRDGGQRIGEMEVWALQAHRATENLRELLTFKSDLPAPHRSPGSGSEEAEAGFSEQGMPETLRIFLLHLRALGIQAELFQGSDTVPIAPDDSQAQWLPAGSWRLRYSVADRKDIQRWATDAHGIVLEVTSLAYDEIRYDCPQCGFMATEDTKTAPPFQVSDLVEFHTLLRRLRAASSEDPAALFVRERCAPDTLRLLEQEEGKDAPGLTWLLTRDLNVLVENTPDLEEVSPFCDMKQRCRPETAGLWEKQDKTTAERQRLNRLLLEDAFAGLLECCPPAVRGTRCPQCGTRMTVDKAARHPNGLMGRDVFGPEEDRERYQGACIRLARPVPNPLYWGGQQENGAFLEALYVPPPALRPVRNGSEGINRLYREILRDNDRVRRTGADIGSSAWWQLVCSVSALFGRRPVRETYPIRGGRTALVPDTVLERLVSRSTETLAASEHSGLALGRVTESGQEEAAGRIPTMAEEDRTPFDTDAPFAKDGLAEVTDEDDSGASSIDGTEEEEQGQSTTRNMARSSRSRARTAGWEPVWDPGERKRYLRVWQAGGGAALLRGYRRFRTGTAAWHESLPGRIEGKTGLIRGYLLGKRVDFSGRAVIVPAPDLPFGCCRLPDAMAKSFCDSLPDGESADLATDAQIRERAEILRERPVLLNRSPTLHRYGVLGSCLDPGRPLSNEAVLALHPLLCAGYGADFDGDTMAVHLPLGRPARAEALARLAPERNLFSVANGDLLLHLAQDIVAGVYLWSCSTERHTLADLLEAQGWLESEAPVTGKKLKAAVSALLWRARGKKRLGQALKVLDTLMREAFRVVTEAGLSFGISDLAVLSKQIKPPRLRAAARTAQGDPSGFREAAGRLLLAALRKQPAGPVSALVLSGARGNEDQLARLCAAVTLRDSSPTGAYLEGLAPDDYYLAAREARRDMLPKKLGTPRGGDLTRKLVYGLYPLRIRAATCDDSEGLLVSASLAGHFPGKFLAVSVAGLKPGVLLNAETCRRIEAQGGQVRIFSPITCRAESGGCARCYGRDLSTREDPEIGLPVGLLAAQSIGERATQDFMKLFQGTGSKAAANLDRAKQLLTAGHLPLDASDQGRNRSVADEDRWSAMKDEEKERWRRAEPGILLEWLIQAYEGKVNMRHFEVALRAMSLPPEQHTGVFRWRGLSAVASGRLHAGSPFAAAAFQSPVRQLMQAAVEALEETLTVEPATLLVGDAEPREEAGHGQ
jgi:hypothetical protein